eukprot:9195773-Lingulodinium_polyedra.AAC.1
MFSAISATEVRSARPRQRLLAGQVSDPGVCLFKDNASCAQRAWAVRVASGEQARCKARGA